MGRPPKPRSQVLSVNVGVRVTRAEYARLKAEAMRQGVTVSNLLMRPFREGNE